MKPLKLFNNKFPQSFKIVGALASISLALTSHNVYADESLEDLDNSDNITEIQDQTSPTETETIQEKQDRFVKRNKALEEIREANLDTGEDGANVETNLPELGEEDEVSEMNSSDQSGEGSDDQSGITNQLSGEGETTDSNNTSVNANESSDSTGEGTPEIEDDSNLGGSSDVNEGSVSNPNQPGSGQPGEGTGTPTQPEPETPQEPSQPGQDEQESPQEPSQPADPSDDESDEDLEPQEPDESDPVENGDEDNLPDQQPQGHSGQKVDIEASLNDEELQMLIDVLLSQGPKEAERLQKSIIDSKIANGQAVYETLPDTSTGTWIMGLLGLSNLVTGLILKRHFNF